jgi:hypothetical protein
MVIHWFLTLAPCRAEPLDAAQLVTEYRPHASVIPPTLDLSPCQPTGAPVLGDGYMWPLCAQPLYHGALPALVNLTVLNGMARVSSFSRAPVFSTSIAAHASLLEISFEHQQLLWPWGGTLGVALRLAFLGFLGAIGLAVDAHDLGAVHQPVHQRDHAGGVGEDLVPLAEGPVRGQDHGALGRVPAADDLEQQVGGAVRVG